MKSAEASGWYMVTVVGNGEAILTARVCEVTFLAKGILHP